MDNKSDNQKSFRILDLFERFNRKEQFKKSEFSKKYQVTDRTIQRDIASLNLYFAAQGRDDRIIFDPSDRVYKYQDEDHKELFTADIYTLCETLMKSRALGKNETTRIINTLISMSGQEKTLQNLLGNSVANYSQVQDDVTDLLGKIIKSIDEHIVVRCTYVTREGTLNELELRPLALHFHQKDFFLIAGLENSPYGNKNTVLQINRIDAYKLTGRRFERDDDLTKSLARNESRILEGPLAKVRFKYWGKSSKDVLDQYPDAVFIGYDENHGAIFEAKVHLDSFKDWVLTQQSQIEVIKPEEVKDDIKRSIKKLVGLYMPEYTQKTQKQ